MYLEHPKRSRAKCQAPGAAFLMTTLGVISDTHGLLRREAVEALRGVSQILHAGDVGSSDVLDGLRAIAPITAVRGNVDREVWARGLPHSEAVEVEGVSIYMLHILDQLDLKPEAAGFWCGRVWAQPCAEIGSEQWSVVFQSGERGATEIQVAGDGGEADCRPWTGAGRDCGVEEIAVSIQ